VARQLVVVGIVGLGLLAAVDRAAGVRSADGEEVQFAFTQAGEPLKHTQDLIETTMVGGGAFDVNSTGDPLGPASGTIVYHESRVIGTNLQLTFHVDGALTVGTVDNDLSSVGLKVTVAHSNDASCSKGSRGYLGLEAAGGEATIRITVCGRTYLYTGKTGARSRIRMNFAKPERCLLGLPACPHSGVAPPTAVTTASPAPSTAPPAPSAAPTELTISDGTVFAAFYLVDSGTHKAGGVTCTGYVPNASSECWAYSNIGKTVTVTATVVGGLAPGDRLFLSYDPGYAGDPNHCVAIDKGSGNCVLAQTTTASSLHATIQLPADKSQTHSTTAIVQIVTPTGFASRALGIGLCDPSKGETAPNC
jgi:hypothetical protein